jgi:hypothetical protein
MVDVVRKLINARTVSGKKLMMSSDQVMSPELVIMKTNVKTVDFGYARKVAYQLFT